MEIEDFIFLMVMVVLVLLLGLGIGVGVLNQQVHELGNAICDEQQDKEFDYYSSGVLHCKDAEQTVPFDGIQIAIQ